MLCVGDVTKIYSGDAGGVHEGYIPEAKGQIDTTGSTARASSSWPTWQ